MDHRVRRSRRIVLAQRPKGVPKHSDFRLEEAQLPILGSGEVLLKTLYLSLDPYMRGRMDHGPSYADPVAIGGTMCGEAVCRVEASNDSRFKEGDRVLAGSGWQDYAIQPATALTLLDEGLDDPSNMLGVLGMPGLTAYVGLLDIGQPQPGDTVVVAAATGAVGSVVGQIAKIKGCRVVGIAGGPRKCGYAVDILGLDACLDHHDPDFAAQLRGVCPGGIDVYFENVGGPVFEAVLPLLNIHARVPVCGVIAFYNAIKLPDGPDRTPLLLRTVLVRRIKLQGYIITDHFDRRAEFLRCMRAWLASGRIHYRMDIIEGLENAPAGLIGLLNGENFGKRVVRVHEA